MDEDVMDSLPSGTSKEHRKRLQEWQQDPNKLKEWIKQTMRLSLLKDAEVALGDDKAAADARKRIATIGIKLLEEEEQ